MEPPQTTLSRRVLISNAISVTFIIGILGPGAFVFIPSLSLPNNNTPSIWCTFIFMYSFGLIFVPTLTLSLYAHGHTTFDEDGVVKQGLFRRKQILWNSIVGVEIAPTRFILYSAETSIYISLPAFANPEPIRAFILAHLPTDLLASLEPSE